jgi:hypothetical protein
VITLDTIQSRTFFAFSLAVKNVKPLMYKSIVLFVVLYGSEKLISYSKGGTHIEDV